jgi:hypothetical protein
LSCVILPQSLMLAGIFVVPLLVAVFLEPLIAGILGIVPNTRRLILQRLGLVAGLLALEVVGCLVIEKLLPYEGSSDMRAFLGCLAWMVFCVGNAAPLSAGLAAFRVRKVEDVP